MSNEKYALEKVLDRLNDKERAAYRLWQTSHRPEISPITSSRMFQLFLNGSTCEQIQQLNPGFSLAQVVQARIAGEWDQKRDEYLNDLLELTRIRVMQSQLEATNFVADLLTAANVEFGDKVKRFLLSRNPDDLGGVRIDSIRDYKEAVQLLLTLTGQDKQQKVSGQVTVTYELPEKIETKDAAKVLSGVVGKYIK